MVGIVPLVVLVSSEVDAGRVEVVVKVVGGFQTVPPRISALMPVTKSMLQFMHGAAPSVEANSRPSPLNLPKTFFGSRI